MSTSNPALAKLGIFIGTWEMEISNASFLPDSTAVLKDIVSVEWVEEGAFLLMRMGISKQPPNALWLIHSDDTTKKYKVFYFDDRKTSRIYDMSFDKKVWKMWRNIPTFSQRCEGKISKDGNIIKAYWEKSFDSISWEHDFDLVYRRK